MSDSIPVDERAFTIAEFCVVERISQPTYFKMRHLGVGPEELVVPGTKVVRITASSRRAWHKRMQCLAQDKAVQLERARRAKQTSAAGKIAAASPRHYSKRRAAR